MCIFHSVGSQSGGSGGGHGGSGGRGGGINTVGVAYDKLYEPTAYGTPGGYGADLGTRVCTNAHTHTHTHNIH